MTLPLFLIIGGGSFQGKSLVALHAACRLRVPAIVCTDTIRNVLTTLQPDAPWLGTSTYLLAPEDLRRQMDAVSGAIQGSLDIFRARGERCIVEGMHLTKKTIEHLDRSQDSLLLCLDNQAAFDRRIDTKSTTRSRLNLERYQEHRERIVEIHCEIVQSYREVGACILSFCTLDDLLSQVDEFLDTQLGRRE